MGILKIMGEIAGIGGLALGVFLLICKQIIAKVNWPIPTKEQAFRLLNRMIVLAFILAVLGIAAWVVLAIVDSLADHASAALHESTQGKSGFINANDAQRSGDGSAKAELQTSGFGVISVIIHGGTDGDDINAKCALKVFSALRTGEHLTEDELAKRMVNDAHATKDMIDTERYDIRRVIKAGGMRVDNQTYSLKIEDSRYYLYPTPLRPTTTRSGDTSELPK